MEIDPNAPGNCSYCKRGPQPLGTFAMRIMGPGTVVEGGFVKSEFRVICHGCLIRAFDAALYPKVEVNP